MEANKITSYPKELPLLIKIENQFRKLKALVQKCPEFDEEVTNRAIVFQNLLNDIKSSDETTLGQIGDIILAMYKNLKQLQQKIHSKLKFKMTDAEASEERYKLLNKPFVAYYDEEIKLLKNTMVKSSDSITIDDLAQVEFKMLNYTVQDLCNFAFNTLKYLNVHPTFSMKDQTLLSLIIEIANRYNTVSYHHFTHGFSVFQNFFAASQRSTIKSYFKEIELFIALISGLSHDLEGVNNGWHAKKKSELAIAYPGDGILENFHISVFFQILKENPEYDFFQMLPDVKAQADLRRLFITNILATDMTKHSKFIEKLASRNAANAQLKEKASQNLEIPDALKQKALNLERFEDRKFISNIMVHACDISTPCLPFDTYYPWAILISQEFNSQTLKEEKHGVEVTGFLKNIDKATVINSQFFFAKHLVLPLWSEIVVLLPELAEFTENLNENIKRLDNEKTRPKQG